MINNKKGKLYAVIEGKDVYFDFQDDSRNYDKKNPQLNLEYLGTGFPFYYEYTCTCGEEKKSVHQGECVHIWRKVK